MIPLRLVLIGLLIVSTINPSHKLETQLYVCTIAIVECLCHRERLFNVKEISNRKTEQTTNEV
jgi:hypothetical protein